MTLQQLRYFLTAAEHGSFSAAAEALHMAQPSLSDQVRRLEAELGVPLFVRAGRRLELTEAGRLLRPNAEWTLTAAESAAASVRDVRGLTGGTVAFGTFGSAHHYLLAGLIEDFRRRHPQVRVRVVGQNSAERSEEHTFELQSRQYLVCRLLLAIKAATSPQVQTTTRTR